jgi:hypothetical protein
MQVSAELSESFRELPANIDVNNSFFQCFFFKTYTERSYSDSANSATGVLANFVVLVQTINTNTEV